MHCDGVIRTNNRAFSRSDRYRKAAGTATRACTRAVPSTSPPCAFRLNLAALDVAAYELDKSKQHFIALVCRETRSPASPPAARSPRAATPPPRRREAQFGCQFRQSFQLILGPTIFDRNALALDVAGCVGTSIYCDSGPASSPMLGLSHPPPGSLRRGCTLIASNNRLDQCRCNLILETPPLAGSVVSVS